MTKPKISLNCALLSSSANLAPNNSTLLRSALLRNWKIVNAKKISKWLQKLYFAILKKDQKGNFLEYFFYCLYTKACYTWDGYSIWKTKTKHLLIVNTSLQKKLFLMQCHNHTQSIHRSEFKVTFTASSHASTTVHSPFLKLEDYKA